MMILAQAGGHPGADSQLGDDADTSAAVKPGRGVSLAALTLVGAMLLASRGAVALDVIAAQTLARQSRCLECHGVYQKKIGPVWKDVASKYRGQPGSDERLYSHITTGRKARFDDGHLEDHPIVKTSDPTRIRNLVAWILALPVAAPVDVEAAQTLARQSRCLKCHAVDVKKVGPAWKDVAAKYLGNVGAEDKLYSHITTGRKARFDDGHEESHPIVKTRDPDRINNLVNWILSLK